MSHQQNEPSPLEIAEYLSLITTLVGAFMATVSGKVFFMAIPVSVTLILNIINRLRHQQQIKRGISNTLRRINQEFTANIKALERQVKGKVFSQDFATQPSVQSPPNQSHEISILQQEIRNLQFQLQSRLSQLQLPNLQPIYEEIKQTSSQRETINVIQRELTTLENSINYVITYLNNASLVSRVTELENNISNLQQPELDQEIQSAIAPLLQRVEDLDQELAQLSEILIKITTQNQNPSVHTPPNIISQDINNLIPIITEEKTVKPPDIEIKLPEKKPPLSPKKNIELIYKNWQCIYNINAHSDWVRSLAITPDNQTLISGSFDSIIKLWNLSNGQLNYELSDHSKGVFCLAISPDGKYFVSGGFDHIIKLWDLTNDELIDELIDHTGTIQCLAISSDNHTLVSGSFDETIKLWQIDTGELIDTLTEYAGPIYAISFSNDGKLIASGGGDGKINLWNLDNKRDNLWLPGGTIHGNLSLVWCLLISSDNQFIISGHGDGLINLYNRQNHQLYKSIIAHSKPVTSIVITPDNKYLISGSADGKIKFWETETGDFLLVLNEDNQNPIISLAMSSNGKILVSGSADGNIKIWGINN